MAKVYLIAWGMGKAEFVTNAETKTLVEAYVYD
jgi:hypothetical protein